MPFGQAFWGSRLIGFAVEAVTGDAELARNVRVGARYALGILTFDPKGFTFDSALDAIADGALDTVADAAVDHHVDTLVDHHVDTFADHHVDTLADHHAATLANHHTVYGAQPTTHAVAPVLHFGSNPPDQAMSGVALIAPTQADLALHQLYEQRGELPAYVRSIVEGALNAPPEEQVAAYQQVKAELTSTQFKRLTSILDFA